MHFHNSYLQLPARFYTRMAPTPVSRPGPIRMNRALAQQDIEALTLLVDYVIERHYPAIAGDENPARALLDAVVVRQSGWDCSHRNTQKYGQTQLPSRYATDPRRPYSIRSSVSTGPSSRPS